MSLAVAYPWLKAMHVAAVLAFVGGVLTVAVLLQALPKDVASSTSIARAVRRWDQAVTTPAMLLVWALGLALATASDAFGDAWLNAKLALVLGLSGLHGVLSGRLRRLSKGGPAQPSRVAAVVLASAAVIAVLAVAKPI